ncbi:MAG: very short patch repair endonuclease [Slackia sp.]
MSVKREHLSYMRKHARSTRCVLHATPAPVRDVAPAVRKSMKGNKGKDTKPELLVRRRLRQAGLGGYRLQWNVPGRPDIAYPGKKVCIFINGCFWHRCPVCKPSMPKTNREYWIPKFERNVERDRRNIALLEQDGWRVHVIWECQLKKKVVDETFAELIPVLESELANR